jgi:hypothetical protein
MMKQDELARLHREVEAELKQKYPGVVGVAWGQKRRGGKPTGEIGFCVYVAEKKDPSRLKPEEILPREYRGFPIDVDQVPDAIRVVDCPDADHAEHSPLTGGITITNLQLGPDGYGLGTLGFLATIDGVAGPDNVVLVTNHHVAMANGVSATATLYQESFIQQPPGGPWVVNQLKPNPVGKIHNAGVEGNIRFHYQNEAEDDYFVDCSSAKLNVCISSWCHTNCGVSISGDIRLLAINGSNTLAGVDRVQQSNINPANPYHVVKVGRATNRSEGNVTRLNVPMLHGEKNVIEITATSINCNHALQFLDHGDSGSALVNAQGKLVGLCFGLDNVDPTLSYACHIHPVLQQLGGITPISTQNPPDSRLTSSEVDTFIQGRPNQTPRLRERFLASPEGQRIAALVEQHRHEVVHLVNHNRRVTVPWRRNQGPAFLNRAINNARDPEERIPREIEGVTRELLLGNMADALSEHGSLALRGAVMEYRETILSFAEEYDSLHELVDRLAEGQLV